MALWPPPLYNICERITSAETAFNLSRPVPKPLVCYLGALRDRGGEMGLDYDSGE